jgi:hypothetical protein
MPLTDLRRAFTPFLSVLVLIACVKPCAVLAANTPPTISGSPPQTAVAGTTYYFKPVVKDPNAGDVFRFSIVNKPGWLSFDLKTGVLTGTPTASNVGVFSGIKIRVSDGTAERSLDTFTITVTKSGSGSSSGNAAPKISGTPITTAAIGKAYSFQPTASDSDGDKLTFSIKNKPGWAGFSTSTGRLYGTPSSSSASTYSSIVISVSDGKTSASLPAFSLNVSGSAAGGDASVTLRWSAPTRNTDGSTVTTLAGYRVYYGQSPGSYSRTLSLPNASLTSVGIEGLATGTWYFAVKALAHNGQESAYSQPVSKLVQ